MRRQLNGGRGSTGKLTDSRLLGLHMLGGSMHLLRGYSRGAHLRVGRGRAEEGGGSRELRLGSAGQAG
jgi:hypothetical protein